MASDALREAAQALVDAWDRTESPHWHTRKEEAFRALRIALASPAPSTSRDDAPDDLPEGFPYTVPGEEYARGCADGRDEALEEAARHFESEWSGDYVPTVVAALRSLKGQPAAPADQSKETDR